MLRTVLILVAALTLSSAGEAPADAAALKQRVVELEAEVAALKQRAVTFKTLADLDVQFWLHSEDEGSGIATKIVEFLGLSADERALLKTAMDQAREQVAAQVAAQKPMAEAVPDGFKLVVQDFSEEGKLIEGQMQKTVKAVLGPDRYRLFRRLMRNNHDTQFLGFGEGTQTFIFTKRDGRWNYRHETKGEGRSGSSSGGLGNSLARYALIRPYLPKELIEDVEGPAKPAQPAAPKGADNF